MMLALIHSGSRKMVRKNDLAVGVPEGMYLLRIHV